MSADKRQPDRVPQASARIPGRVLVVDDDAPVRRFVAKVLTDVGHAVQVAGGVDEAVVRLGGESYDVALVDLNMPVRSGLELLEVILATGVPVVPVLLTGTTDIGAAVGGMKRGAFDYVAKPVEPEALCWAIDRAIRAAHARHRARLLESVVSEWAATFDACPDLLLILDPEGRVLRANEAAARASGVRGTDPVGATVEDLFPGGLGAAIRTRQRARPDSGADHGEAARVFDAALNGYFLLSVNPIRTDSATCAVVVRDVTAIERRKEERKRLLRRVLTAQEDERGRLARELHDGVGQALVSLAVGLAALDADGASERVGRLRKIAAESLDEIRRLAHGLRPPVLDDLGLEAALARLTDTFTRVHGVRAELLTPGGGADRLPREVESALYRIVQEALTNVAKYARARTVDVVLESGGGVARVSVSDDGVGFPTGDPDRPPGGLGLTGIEERANLLGGTLRLESVVGRGTTLDVRIPIPEGAK
jgi:PAS domain S-box-containing protein